ncbi:sensor histidine kinase [Tabrizicola sp. TH137]|uniref:sensor histidine kinase n=1 Tax=Tabrizicola sp. TH137 TaxID=2067452 RepID=UPI001303FBB4|nr:ATP-binding protein [Tabrizicola sp. TH137]
MSLLIGATSLRDSPHHLRMLTIFFVISFLAIFSTAAILSTALSRYIIHQMMMRDAMVSTEFLNSIVHVEQAAPYFMGITDAPTPPDVQEFVSHVSRLPDVFRANVYAFDGHILWSSDPQMVGKRFEDNEELEHAMDGRLEPELSVVSRGDKDEHVGFPDGVDRFIEYYIPIRREITGEIVGAVEVYKAPESLLASMTEIRKLAWLGALAAGCALFGGLAVVVAYASRVLQRQEARIVETERLAVVGEMASAVAHGLRNPLAAIRSCAELTMEDDIPDHSRDAIRDITNQVDRLESWIRAFLIRSRNDPGSLSDQAQIDQVIQRCLENFEPQMRKRGIVSVMSGGRGHPIALAQPSELEQVLNSIISNSIEAMQKGGKLGIGWSSRPDGKIAITITDTGPGIPPDMVGRLFKPFETGKAAGLGVGLALGRRIVERMGGSLDLKNRPSEGVEVTLILPGHG